MDNFEKLKESFQNPSLLELALTHKSWVNEHPNIRESNERLEFLGDAVLEFIVSQEIYNKFPEKEEGFLTALRASLVNTINLALLAKKIKIGEKLYLSKGEEDGGGRTNQSILANTIEAVIGALFLDTGIDSAKKFISSNILIEIEEKIKEPLKDAKSRLQEYVQSLGYPAPKYEVTDEEGPDHNKIFTIQVMVDQNMWGKGSGKNKSEAAQEAAKNALERVT